MDVPRKPTEELASFSHHLPAVSVAGVVLQAARRSAGLSERGLADAVHLDENTVRAWEDGTEPLASAPISQLDNLIDTLRAAGANPDLVADIDAAAWSDVVLAAMADREDTSCLLADPLACTRNFAELLDWASTGNIPARYSPYASSATFTGGVPGR
jgi:DNA-binding transcriptional regulator YiaG